MNDRASSTATEKSKKGGVRDWITKRLKRANAYSLVQRDDAGSPEPTASGTSDLWTRSTVVKGDITIHRIFASERLTSDISKSTAAKPALLPLPPRIVQHPSLQHPAPQETDPPTFPMHSRRIVKRKTHRQPREPKTYSQLLGLVWKCYSRRSRDVLVELRQRTPLPLLTPSSTLKMYIVSLSGPRTY